MGLFKDFKKVSHKEWQDKIEVDLKGKDFNETLVWNSEEDIAVQPFYNSLPLKNVNTPIKASSCWKIRETIHLDSPEQANQKALLALKGGANSIQFIGEIKNQTEMDVLLKDIQTDIIDLNFYTKSPLHTSKLVSPKEGSISYDFLGNNLTINTDELTQLISLENSFFNWNLVQNMF